MIRCIKAEPEVELSISEEALGFEFLIIESSVVRIWSEDLKTFLCNRLFHKGKGLAGEDEENSFVIPTTFERLEYEALAEKKRKALFDSQRDGSEKRGKYDAKELVFTGRRRRRRKQSDYVSKAVQADPEDIDLKYEYADLCLSAGIYKEAAETYEKIFRRHPEIIEPLKRGTEYFLKSGKGERAANMLEDHIKSHPSEVGPDILDLLADVLMQINAYDRALKYIHDVRQIYNLGKELPSSLKIRQAICHVRLEEMEQAEIVLNILPREAVSEHPKLIIDLADELTNIENFHSALKYYLLAINDTLNVSKSIRQLYSIVSSLTTFASSLW
ncbi:hypothetical protein Bca101_101641 [Brassica carinata]